VPQDSNLYKYFSLVHSPQHLGKTEKLALSGVERGREGGKGEGEEEKEGDNTMY
jgi:hypothetical protein